MSDDHKFKNSSGNLTCNDSILEEQGQPADTLILQCSNCNTIIGDTTAWGSCDPILRIIGLKHASDKLLITEVLETSKNGTDVGSTYNVLRCEECNDELGKMYRTTPLQLDHLRGLFSVNMDKFSCYQVGSGSQNGETVSISDALSFGECREMKARLQKIQHVVITMDSRIKHIETYLTEEYDDELEDTENTISESERPRQSDGFVSDIHQPRVLNSRHDVMSTMIGTAPIPKQISPQQSVSSFPPMRPAFMRPEKENSGDSLRNEDHRRQSVEGVRSNGPALMYVEPMKRKCAPRCDSSLRQRKRSRY